MSSSQGTIAWPQVADDHVSFVYIKATQGATYVNPYFAADWQGARRSGLAYGAYEFFSLCSSGLSQAQNFLTTVPPDDAALPPAVDLELKGNCTNRPTAATVATQLSIFVTAVQRATGNTVIFYIGRDFAARYNVSALHRGPQWKRQVKRPTTRAIVIWQVYAPIPVNGIQGHVDLDLTQLPTLRALHS